ncbi:hypothetical protein F0562_029413 [Nyssa sinensis]|uniref:Uncharacterized protein n=1 Tax=Nyssa sinensis TaxID=561372 RepID=A0A5J5B0Z4_9ASTE|nr:hypothetical protein F0562_029413 [Nyssa sinensis]
MGGKGSSVFFFRGNLNLWESLWSLGELEKRPTISLHVYQQPKRQIDAIQFKKVDLKIIAVALNFHFSNPRIRRRSRIFGLEIYMLLQPWGFGC